MNRIIKWRTISGYLRYYRQLYRYYNGSALNTSTVVLWIGGGSPMDEFSIWMTSLSPITSGTTASFIAITMVVWGNWRRSSDEWIEPLYYVTLQYYRQVNRNLNGSSAVNRRRLSDEWNGSLDDITTFGTTANLIATIMVAHWIHRRWSQSLETSKRCPEQVLRKHYYPRTEFPNLLD